MIFNKPQRIYMCDVSQLFSLILVMEIEGILLK
jgi:hypothetical protein